MKKSFVPVTIAILTLSLLGTCQASEDHLTFPITASLKNGSATYEEVLDWSKQKIQKEAEKDHTADEINTALQEFPAKTEEQCDQMKLLFIKNSPQCGAVNCDALMFKQTSASTYQYLSDVNFAAVRLFCFPEKNAAHYYLVTNLEESNSASNLQLDEIVNDKLQLKGTRHLDYTSDSDNKLADSLWEKQVDESGLLKIFK